MPYHQHYFFIYYSLYSKSLKQVIVWDEDYYKNGSTPNKMNQDILKSKKYK